MALLSPNLAGTLVIADNARLAAQLSCLYAEHGAYLPVIDGPRMDRPDHAHEVTRRNNVAARVRPDLIVTAGIASAAHQALLTKLPKRIVKKVDQYEDIKNLPQGRKLQSAPLVWGQDRIGVGLLLALRAQTSIVFESRSSERISVPTRDGHVVVCEEGNEISEVIAANYAYSMKAGLHMIPAVEASETERVLERFYSLYEDDASPTGLLVELKHHLRSLCGEFAVPQGGSVTFICSGLPFGFAYPEHPATHLRTYPDLGRTVVNGFVAEARGGRGVNIAVFVDPETTDAPEIADAVEVFKRRGLFMRGYRGQGATVRRVSEVIHHFPYDLLVIATHCGDASGWRFTYEFKDREGADRVLVTDVAVGVGDTDDDDLFEVTEFVRFKSLDGVDWHDPEKHQKIKVGFAIADYAELSRLDRIEPTERVPLERVVGSAALKMFDHNYIAVPTSIADEGTPIIINNACASWRELSERFMFGNCRMYVGSLFPIATTEAHDVVVRVFEKHFDKPLPHAFWSAQNDVYGDAVRRPYVASGVYTQRLRTTQENTPLYIHRRLSHAHAVRSVALQAETEPRIASQLQRIADYLRGELDHFDEVYKKARN